ncbi:MAG: hypothetical protein C0498_01310 [Anaerolinea sp.]|nr:hypothetical protein [Anaerolinea sp.]
MSWASIDWGEMMAAVAGTYGYTPAQFMRLTLPQLAAFSGYLSRQAERTDRGRAGPAGGGSVNSLDELVAMFGDEASRAALAGGRL